MNQPQKMTVEELLERNPIKRPIQDERILPSPEVSKPQLYDMVMREKLVILDPLDPRPFPPPSHIYASKPKIEFIPFNNISIKHRAEITNNNLFDLLFDMAINMNIINKNIENIINHLNNE